MFGSSCLVVSHDFGDFGHLNSVFRISLPIWIQFSLLLLLFFFWGGGGEITDLRLSPIHLYNLSKENPPNAISSRTKDAHDS